MGAQAEHRGESPEFGGMSAEAFLTGSEIHTAIRALKDRGDRLEVIPHLLGAATYELMGENCTVEEIDAMLEGVEDTKTRLEGYKRSVQIRIETEQRRATELVED